jgi:SET domain-containing protein
MWLIETYVAESKIHGLGVFTKVPIKKGEIAWRFEPTFDRMFTRQQFAALPAVAQNFIHIRGFLDKEKNLYFLGGDFDLFTNHSDEPNLVVDPNYAGEFSADLIAIRDIIAGEELTNNYSEYCADDDVQKKFSS